MIEVDLVSFSLVRATGFFSLSLVVTSRYNSGTKRRHKGAFTLVGESELKRAKMYGILHQNSAVATFFDFPRQKL
jgi:hypothetical protein